MEPKSLNDNIALLMGQATHLMSLKISRLFREKGYKITVEQFTVLTILWYQDGLPQKTIAKQINRDKTTITRVVDNMMKDNLIVRIPSEKDKRIKLIYLTHKGKSMQNELMMSSGQIYMKAIDGLSRADIDSANMVMNKIIKNLK